MKKLALIFTFALALASTCAFAYDRDGGRDRDSYRGDRLEWRIHHLHRMLDRVRADVSSYRGDWRLRREVDRVADDVNRIDWRFRHNRQTWRLRAEIDGARDRLHQIELRLHLRRGEWYRWD
jgi:hypothetical protein